MSAAPTTLRRHPGRHANNGNGRVAAPEPHPEGTRRPAMPELPPPAVPEPAASPPTASRRPGWQKGLALAGLAAALVVGGRAGAGYLDYSASHESTDDAFLAADITEVAPQVSARVTQVLVRDNQEVKAGDLLVVLNRADYQAALAQAQVKSDGAAVRASQSQVKTAEAGVQTAQAVVQSDLATYHRARRDAQRDMQLLSGGYLGGQQADQAVTLVQQLQAQIAGDRQKVASAEAHVESARQQ